MKTTWSKNVVRWTSGRTLYLSVPFTWLLPRARVIAARYDGYVVAGGPAVRLMGAPWANETPTEAPADVLAMHNQDATFTTRGCPRACPFCAVPRIEGKFRELREWRVAPIVCDNNLLAASARHFERVVESLRGFDEVDFNQGLDARLFRAEHAELLRGLRKPHIRFAFDAVGTEQAVRDAVALARGVGLRLLHVYVLVGFREPPEQALYRLETVRSWGIRPNPMRYQPLDATRKNSYVAPGWSPTLLQDVMRYYSRLRWLEHIPFEEYQSHERARRFKMRLAGRGEREKFWKRIAKRGGVS